MEISESEARMLQSEIDRLKGRIENLEDRIKKHAESEDECKRCGGQGFLVSYAEEKEMTKPCPDCTDDHVYGGYDRDDLIPEQPPEYRLDDGDEPRPEDEEFEMTKETYREIISCLHGQIDHLESEIEDRKRDAQYWEQRYKELDQGLEDVREEREFWIDKYHKEQNERLRLRKRIEEARHYVEEWDKRLHDRFGDLARLKEILSPKSDEVDNE